MRRGKLPGAAAALGDGEGDVVADSGRVRVEGEPAVNPSWWTLRTDFKRSYQKIGDFWLPESNESETKVRVFGTAVLSIEYRDYRITQAGGATLASPNSEALAATIADEF